MSPLSIIIENCKEPEPNPQVEPEIEIQIENCKEPEPNPQAEPEAEIRCVICTDSEDIESKFILAECLHSFHKDCLLRWLSIHNNCPLCRMVLNINDYREDEKIPPEFKEEVKYIPPSYVPHERKSNRIVASYESDLPLSLQYNLPQHNTYRTTSMNPRQRQRQMANHFLGFHHMNRNPLG